MIRVPVEVARAHASRERRKAVEPDRAGQPSLRDTILLAYLFFSLIVSSLFQSWKVPEGLSSSIS